MPWAGNESLNETYRRWTWYPPADQVETAMNLAYALPVQGVEYDDGQPAEAPFTDIPLSPGRPYVRVYLTVDDANKWEATMRERVAARGWLFESDAVKSEDWANAWKRYYVPQVLRHGYTVVPSWTSPSPADEAHTLWLDPGMAFGTGTHATTRLCANALLDLDLGGQSVLDLGAGSGILGLLAAKRGAERVLMVEPDPVAVDAIRHNVHLNHLEDAVSVLAGTLHDVKPQPFDYLFLNLIWDIIHAEWQPLQAYLVDSSMIFLSGLLPERRDALTSLVASTGHHVVRIEEQDGWIMAVVRR
ncbi:50S ribosomal protein L11 methyltransferase [Sulfobacillus harzensis]|uniref:50S ribosomal protein L11 methyltransferase n=1 Tax=Sulfobacillus harzensis TaxID=2729629 RepID=A0A7Y0L472_9FIRM|nr:50S ribosomal protein L11 methyltransferase [Sulfobacillus harzensis]NMP23003.1 50S ribosomal protein L11 methyltransferase [Sulfobacillus harzensis]